MSECHMCGKTFAQHYSYLRQRHMPEPWLYCDDCNKARLKGCKTCAYYGENAQPQSKQEYRQRGPHCRAFEIAEPMANRPRSAALNFLCSAWKRKVVR